MKVKDPDDVKLAFLDYDRCGVLVNGVRYELHRSRREDLAGEALKDFDSDNPRPPRKASATPGEINGRD